MGANLAIANEGNAYTITHRGTYLALQSVSLIPHTRNTKADGELNLLRGKVASVVPGLRKDRVTVLCGNLLLSARRDHNSVPDYRTQEGDEVIAAIRPDAVHVISPVAA